jgi:arylsulfatase A-like enzyme
MRRAIALLFSVLLVVSIYAAPAASSKPNILFILVDDLGYGDVGVFYQNGRYSAGQPAFSTPNLDAMARDGLMLTQHYCAAPVCAPARASLITGLSQGHCPIRDNQFDKPLPEGILTLPAVLREAGYHTAGIGKWGLGGKAGSGWPAHPMRRGFDEFFGFMMHKYGHVYYHDAAHPLMDDLNDVGAKYENVYSTDLFTARAKKFITEHHAGHPDQPFFLYLAYTAVHNALDVPGNAFPEGAGLSGGLHWPVTPTPQTRNKWIHPDYASQPWPEPMKRYATMVRRLDDGVGDIRQLLVDLKIDRDTLVVFTSDNGPANEGGADPRLFSSWGPFDGFKRDILEGGVREPTMVVWPGQIKPGRVSDFVSAQYDWMPTLAEVAHLAPPAHSDGISLVPTILNKGEQRPHPYIYVEYFHGGKNPASNDVFARKNTTGRGQQQMVRIGDFAGVRVQITHANDPLRLYNVIEDPHQDHNLAGVAARADLLRRMTELLVTARRPDSDAPRPYDDVVLPAVKSDHLIPKHLSLQTYTGQWPWTPDFTALAPGARSTADAIRPPEQDAERPFGLHFQGYLSVPVDGNYTFTASSDGGCDVWLHDAHLIDADHCAADHPIVASIRLAAGLHPIRVAYLHRTGTPTLSLRYAGPNLPEQEIPQAALSMDKQK